MIEFIDKQEVVIDPGNLHIQFYDTYTIVECLFEELRHVFSVVAAATDNHSIRGICESAADKTEAHTQMIQYYLDELAEAVNLKEGVRAELSARDRQDFQVACAEAEVQKVRETWTSTSSP